MLMMLCALFLRRRAAAVLQQSAGDENARHGGMTELEEAELTDGQGRALSAHKSRAYEGYAKRTMERALAATRKRHALGSRVIRTSRGTEFPNGAAEPFPNELKKQTVTPK
jgi:hypothetical protein